jgi:hypothetical protein
MTYALDRRLCDRRPALSVRSLSCRPLGRCQLPPFYAGGARCRGVCRGRDWAKNAFAVRRQAGPYTSRRRGPPGHISCAAALRCRIALPHLSPDAGLSLPVAA